jgi:hypothetical protein
MFTANPELPDLKADSAGTWQQGQTVKTPETRLAWNCLADWVQVWETLQRRRVSSNRYQQESNHIRALPVEMIAEETNSDTLYAFLEIMVSNAGNRPRKGEREGHPITEMVVVANNRLAQVGALPYREHRRQRGLRRTLFRTAASSRNPARRQGAEATAPHLSLF